MKDSFEFNKISELLYGVSPILDSHFSDAYGYVLLVIAGADGKVSNREIAWLTKYLASMMGFPKSSVEKWKRFDYLTTPLEEVLKPFKKSTSSLRKLLIYDSIRMCNADSIYALKERKAVFQAAGFLNISKSNVEAIECLVDSQTIYQKHLRVLLHSTD